MPPMERNELDLVRSAQTLGCCRDRLILWIPNYGRRRRCEQGVAAVSDLKESA